MKPPAAAVRRAGPPTLRNLNGPWQEPDREREIELSDDEEDEAQSSSDGSEDDDEVPSEHSGSSGSSGSDDDDADEVAVGELSSSETDDCDDGSSVAIRCTVCQRGNRAAEMLLCDQCDAAVHLSCHDPPMTAVPQLDYFCSRCCASVGYPDRPDGCIPSVAQVSLVLNELLEEVTTLCWRERLAEGDRCDLLDRTGSWFGGRVVQVRHGPPSRRAQCLVHYDGWSTRLDEWLPVDSDCLQMPGTQDRNDHSHRKRRRGANAQQRKRRRRPVRTPPSFTADEPQGKAEKKKGVVTLKPAEDAANAKIARLPLVETTADGVEAESSAEVRRRLGLKACLRQRRNPLQPFCLFENVANMPKGEVDRATEELKMPFTVVNSGDISAARRLRCYWSNSGFPPEFTTKDLAHNPPLTIGEFIGEKTLATLKWPVRIQ
eukprot:COSAG06_NODE_1334_length_9834_cov_2.689985_6_plen_432_part_00